jgi:cytochrome b561
VRQFYALARRSGRRLLQAPYPKGIDFVLTRIGITQSGGGMRLSNSPIRYGLVAQGLHWSVVALLAVQFFLAEAADDLPSGAEKLAMLARHKSVGITILLVALVRLIWRLVDRPPAAPPMPAWQRIAAAATHWGLYGILLAMPLSGWMMSSAEGYPVSWFTMVQLPDLVMPSESLGDVLHDAHEVLAGTLLFLIGLHVLAALKHQFVDRDGLLTRMLPWGHRD